MVTKINCFQSMTQTDTVQKGNSAIRQSWCGA